MFQLRKLHIQFKEGWDNHTSWLECELGVSFQIGCVKYLSFESLCFNCRNYTSNSRNTGLSAGRSQGASPDLAPVVVVHTSTPFSDKPWPRPQSLQPLLPFSCRRHHGWHAWRPPRATRSRPTLLLASACRACGVLATAFFVRFIAPIRRVEVGN